MTLPPPSNTNEHNIEFGKTLRALRQERQLSQEALAFDCGLDRTYISLLELGAKSPTLNTIVALCLALRITLVSFFREMENRTAGEPR